jgi:hypothetical protein
MSECTVGGIRTFVYCKTRDVSFLRGSADPEWRRGWERVLVWG